MGSSRVLELRSATSSAPGFSAMRFHKCLRVNPAMAAYVSDHGRTLEEMFRLAH
jgi:hypothetical protein